jgi:hypothetical protein
VSHIMRKDAGPSAVFKGRFFVNIMLFVEGRRLSVSLLTNLLSNAFRTVLIGRGGRPHMRLGLTLSGTAQGDRVGRLRVAESYDSGCLSQSTQGSPLAVHGLRLPRSGYAFIAVCDSARSAADDPAFVRRVAAPLRGAWATNDSRAPWAITHGYKHAGAPRPLSPAGDNHPALRAPLQRRGIPQTSSFIHHT